MLDQPGQSPLTLHDRFAATAARHPDVVATIESVAGTPVRTTYAELAAEVADVRRRLAAHGVGRGDRVAYWGENRRELLVWQVAVAATGAGLVGTNTRYRAPEVGHVLETARPVLVVMPRSLVGLALTDLLHSAVDRAAQAVGADWVAPQVAVMDLTRPTGVPAPARGAEDLAAFDAGAGAWWADEPAVGDLPDPVGTPEDLAMTFTTSGSTGLPKLAAHAQRGIARHAEEVAAATGLGVGDVMCAALPMTGVFSYVPAVSALLAGASTLLVPVFDGAGTIALMAEHGVTHTAGGDDFYLGLATGWEAERPALPAWRVAAEASFIGRVEQLNGWLQECSGASMRGVYGSSEVFSLVSIRDADADPTTRHLGGGRLVSADLGVRTVDPVGGEPLAPGEVGLLQFRGYNVVDAYLRGAEQVPPPLVDGWFDSGDLGSVDADGRTFTYEGRAGDAMRLRGFLVQPAEIEHFLIEDPSVGMVKVVGAQVEGRDVAVAFVTAAEGRDVDPEALRAACKAELAPFKVPERVVVIDEMPVTSGTNGSKIKAGVLRERAGELLAPR
ncbi:fatty acid CoA ligase [Marmoricola endophyticus]|uniref:Long-chain-fatty-acid--CoA ligase n=1 Tax=Marmoricola endophyticus TaxID=2040280 RepID=A0A917F5C3_9ACTN|nr:AMP-binding protein [Marmoricola endophyticus]GGF48234.1 fatty acid CoA ligase [Marmoricola endophyticus]